jgi:hypothetical protein
MVARSVDGVFVHVASGLEWSKCALCVVLVCAMCVMYHRSVEGCAFDLDILAYACCVLIGVPNHA